MSSERVVDEARENSRAISRLVDFHYSEDGRDRGTGSTSRAAGHWHAYLMAARSTPLTCVVLFGLLVREKSKHLMDLLTDRDKLNEVRTQARENQVTHRHHTPPTATRNSRERCALTRLFVCSDEMCGHQFGRVGARQHATHVVQRRLVRVRCHRSYRSALGLGSGGLYRSVSADLSRSFDALCADTRARSRTARTTRPHPNRRRRVRDATITAAPATALPFR